MAVQCGNTADINLNSPISFGLHLPEPGLVSLSGWTPSIAHMLQVMLGLDCYWLGLQVMLPLT